MYIYYIVPNGCAIRSRVGAVSSVSNVYNIDHRTGILKVDVSSVSASSERIEELWVVCRFTIYIVEEELRYSW